MSDSDSAPSADGAQAFYGQWAGVYDLVARYTPGVPTLRQRVRDACRLEPGDTVVEMGCGTGANLPYLREAVGPSGTVIGIDFTGPVLQRAHSQLAQYDNVHLVQADATQPPLSDAEPIDAVVATFVVGMLPDPAGAVDDWCDRVGPGGHVVLANAARSEEWYAPLVNAVFKGIVIGSTPPTWKLRYEEDLTARLDARIESAHERLRDRSDAVAETRQHFGLVRLTGGRVGSD